ncbi:MAG TPA: DEAD/DEAH box helicase [Limnochordia bacterium]|nr:DEAD/DEAH box helicase [Limnochordia bacterium]
MAEDATHALSVQALKGVGPARAAALAELGVESVLDLRRLAPLRYEDFSAPVGLDQAATLPDGASLTAAGRIAAVRVRALTNRRRLALTQARLTVDGGGTLDLVWFTPTRGRHLPPSLVAKGDEVVVHGRIKRRAGEIQLHNPAVSGREAARARPFRPVYPLRAGIGQLQMRKLVQAALAAGPPPPEPWPKRVGEDLGLCDETRLEAALHRPESRADIALAHRRLAFDEAYLVALQAAGGHQGRAAVLTAGPLCDAFMAGLGFAPTPGQRAAVAAVARATAGERPARILLQGDVGSGKTAVAAYALALAADSGRHGLLAAPSAMLCEQHERSLRAWFAPLGLKVYGLSAETPAAARRDMARALAAPEPCLVVGTHALLHAELPYERIGLVVIDEQHRFGVRQRGRLIGGDAPLRPYALALSATPIPRSLALALFANHEQVVIPDKPPGRSPVDTRCIDPGAAQDAYRLVKRRVAAGERAYLVTASIRRSADGEPGAVELAESLAKGPLRGVSVGLVHGEMADAELSAALAAFRRGETPVLVGTSVLEVGLDVPEATLMLIHRAERFGLAQLHQLRGRVGRGVRPGVCLLLSRPSTPEQAARLDALRREADGFAIAELDLAQRGAGELYGARQAGGDEFARLDWTADLELIKAAAAAAKSVLAERAHAGVQA